MLTTSLKLCRSGEEVRKSLVSSFLTYTAGTITGITKEEDIKGYQPGRVLSVPAQGAKETEQLEVEYSEHAERWGAGFVEQLHILSSRTLRTRRTEAFGVTKYVNSLGVALIGGKQTNI